MLVKAISTHQLFRGWRVETGAGPKRIKQIELTWIIEMYFCKYMSLKRWNQLELTVSAGSIWQFIVRFRMFIEDHRGPKKQCPFSCPSWRLRSCDTDYSVEEHLIRTLHCWHLTFAESLLDHCWPSVNLCLSPCHTSHISAEGWWFDHCGFRFLRGISDYSHQFRYCDDFPLKKENWQPGRKMHVKKCDVARFRRFA